MVAVNENYAAFVQPPNSEFVRSENWVAPSKSYFLSSFFVAAPSFLKPRNYSQATDLSDRTLRAVGYACAELRNPSNFPSFY